MQLCVWRIPIAANQAVFDRIIHVMGREGNIVGAGEDKHLYLEFFPNDINHTVIALTNAKGERQVIPVGEALQGNELDEKLQSIT